MSRSTELTVAGDTDLARAMARHARSSGSAATVHLWDDPNNRLPSDAPVIIVSDSVQRFAYASAAVRSETRVVSLPIPGAHDELGEAIRNGHVMQVSRLHGSPTLARLRTESNEERLGRRYGVYAAHRIPRNHAGDVEQCRNDLLVYVSSLLDTPSSSARVTTASFAGSDIDAWFILARFADETIATIEVAAVLPESEDPVGELQIEVTGSNAVLRADPERQSVIVANRRGTQRYPWYAEATGPLLEHCLRTLEEQAIETQVATVDLLRIVSEAATSDRRVEVQ